MFWNFFSICFTDATNIFTDNAGVFGKVYFPRLAVSINKFLTNAIKLGVQFLLLMVFLAYYLISDSPVRPSWFLVLFPFLIIWTAAIGTGMGLIISSLTTKYRDLKQLVTFALGLAMYATPVVYPLSQIPERFQWVAYANPVCAPIELFRIWFFGAGSVTMPMILCSSGITVLLVLFGLILFNQNEQNFIDVI
jgi:lipopolysaccharide transport system permease protein